MPVRAPSSGSPPARVAVVLPGGGARGAYEAGALAVLLPALEARGERVTIYSGTSVGAINAVVLAAMAHRSADAQASALVERWRGMRKTDVIARIVGPGLAVTALRFVGEALHLPGIRTTGLLDPSPLRDSLERWIDWVALQRNVRRGTVDAVTVVATGLSRGGPVAFTQTRQRLPRPGGAAELRFVRTTLAGEHVRASAAIPLLFAPVQVTRPRAARDHYIDGGTRLNTPLKPALALGADRVIVVGVEPLVRRTDAGVREHEPRQADVVANILDGLLVDQVGTDLHRLAAINSFFVDGVGAGPSNSARAYRVSRGRQPYRRIAYALVAPERRGEIGALAEAVFERRFGGWRGVRAPDYPLLAHVLGGPSRARGELLSFLLFDEAFTEALMDLGRRDALRWLDRHPRVWCSDAAHDFDVDSVQAETVREQQTLTEFRELHRH
jgi:NTE family protein